MGLRPRETVIIAEDFQAMGGWYQAILNFEAVNLVDEEYHYCNLKNEAGLQIGIAEAAELGVTPIDRRHHTVVLQFEVPDVKRLFERLRQRGGEISFGPSFDSKNGFWYGGFHDLEGNPFWAVDENCPQPPSCKGQWRLGSGFSSTPPRTPPGTTRRNTLSTVHRAP